MYKSIVVLKLGLQCGFPSLNYVTDYLSRYKRPLTMLHDQGGTLRVNSLCKFC